MKIYELKLEPITQEFLDQIGFHMAPFQFGVTNRELSLNLKYQYVTSIEIYKNSKDEIKTIELNDYGKEKYDDSLSLSVHRARIINRGYRQIGDEKQEIYDIEGEKIYQGEKKVHLILEDIALPLRERDFGDIEFISKRGDDITSEYIGKKSISELKNKEIFELLIEDAIYFVREKKEKGGCSTFIDMEDGKSSVSEGLGEHGLMYSKDDLKTWKKTDGEKRARHQHFYISNFIKELKQ